MPFTMRMHVEGAVQLVDRRATEPAVEDGERLAHALPPAGCSCLFRQRSTSAQGMQAEMAFGPGPGWRRGPFADAKNSVLLALRNRSARQADLGEHCRVITQGLVHVRDHLHDLAEQGA